MLSSQEISLYLFFVLGSACLCLAFLIFKANNATKRICKNDSITHEDMLHHMFAKQYDLQKKLGYDINHPTQQYLNYMFMGIVTEACEAIENTPWKPWKKISEMKTRELQEEVIDIWHFLINLSIASGMTADDVYRIFNDKNAVNHSRQDGGRY